MYKILLACSAGMSTSLLVTRMREVAEQKGIEAEIEAMSADNAFKVLKNYDVLLIGPQMRFMKKKFEKAASDEGIELTIESIDPMSYGRIDGEGVLDQAVKLTGK